MHYFQKISNRKKKQLTYYWTGAHRNTPCDSSTVPSLHRIVAVCILSVQIILYILSNMFYTHIYIEIFYRIQIKCSNILLSHWHGKSFKKRHIIMRRINLKYYQWIYLYLYIYIGASLGYIIYKYIGTGASRNGC